MIQQRNILELGDELGRFDYILVHGVYSWVPDDVQTKILSVCREHLNPSGVAYISYNTNPGWRMRGMLRDMMPFHTEQFSDPKTKARQARSLIQFLAEAATGDNPYGMLLKKELASMKEWPDEYFLHDSLSGQE